MRFEFHNSAHHRTASRSIRSRTERTISARWLLTLRLACSRMNDRTSDGSLTTSYLKK
jgi:hypothetical protein